MRILHITFSMEQGGVDTLLLELLPRIQSSQYQIDILILAKDRNGLQEELKRSGINVINGSFKNIYDPRNILYIHQLIKNYDIVHSHLFPAQYFLPLATIGLRVVPKIVTTEHCNTNKRRSSSFFRIIERFIYNKYDKIIGVCDAAAKNLVEWTGLGTKIIYINNGVDFKRLIQAPAYTKADIGFTNCDVVIMMIARFFSQKNHATAIDAFQYLPPNFKLVLVGSGELMEECKMRVNQLNLSKKILFLGKRDDVPSLIHCADIGLLSTHFEGLPISLLEFLKLGKPIIGTKVDGITELIENDDFLFPDGDAEALSRCIIRMFNSLLLEQTINDKKIERYDINRTAREYQDLYRSLL